MKEKLLHRKRTTFAVLFSLLLNVVGLNANPVDINTAREVGFKFMNANAKTPMQGIDELQLVTTYNISRGDAAFHIFNTPNGFVIVSADDCATPILGYSNEGRFDVNNIPIQLQDYLQGFVEQIQYGIENNMEADEKTVQQWELVRTIGRLTNNRSDEVVEPLLSTKWHQDYPYNIYVPDGCPTGCVATAMAQIMKYWEWPVQGTGEHSYQWNGQTLSANFGETTYDWGNMIDDYDVNSTQEQKEAVATLMWHCGVSVNMYYASGGSSAHLFPSSLIDYFNYSDDLHAEYRQDDESWMSLLKADLDLGRPVYYEGSNINQTQGHAFVCDGYDANDRFHFNFGGGDSSEAYFALNANGFSMSNYGIFNIHPNASISRQVTASVSPFDGGIAAGAGTYDIGSICTMTATANEGYTFMYWTEEDEVVSSHAEYSFCVRKDRDLVAHFGTPFPIEVVIDPEESGIVSGTGEYDNGSTCTLSATANEGYEFICWRRANGSVASTASTYSFTVTEATTLTAVFAVSGGEQIAFADLSVKALCVANWDTNGDGELSYAEAAAVTDLGSVFRFKSTITSFEELQYFTGLTTISNGAFEGCRNLSGSLCTPNSVTTIGDYAFVNCSGFTGSLTLGNSVTTIGNHAFWGCSGFTGGLTLGNSVTTIGDYAFWGCSGFTGGLTLGNSVTTIGNYAFGGCSGFTGSLTLGNSVTTIGDWAFYGCGGFTGSLVITNSVTEIRGGAFYNCSGFTGSLIIGNSVTTIGGSAFKRCSGFTGDLIIPDSVTTIGDCAFENCSGFTGNLTIGNSVTTIGNSAFYGCSGFMGSLTIGNFVTTIGNSAFYGCSGFTGSLVITNSVTEIRGGAFYNCSGFTGSLIIGNSVTTIGNSAFSGCSGFTGNLTIGNSVTSIGNSAFSGCSGFTGNLTIGNSVTTIGDFAFAWSRFSGGLTLGSSVTTIGNQAFATYHNGFSFITSLAETPPSLEGEDSGGFCFLWDSNIPVYVPCGFEEIYASTSWGCFNNFYGICGGTVSVAADPEGYGIVMGGGTYEAGQICTVTAAANEGYSFANWSRNGVILSTNAEYTFFVASDVTLVAHFAAEGNIVFADANVKSICVSNWDTDGDGELNFAEAASVTDLGSVFRNNSDITVFDELQYFVGLTSIGVTAFCNCSGLTSIVIPNSVTSIDGSAFYGCSGLTSIEIPNYVTSIGGSAFYGCSGLTSIEIPNSVTSISDYAFNECIELTSIVLPNSVTSIGNGAFAGCSSLTGALTIPDSVTTIGGGAFYGCIGLTSLTLPNSLTSISDYTFYNCSGFTGNLTIPNSVTSIGYNAFYGCVGLTSLTLPNSLTSISDYTFYNCSGFTGNLTIPNSVTSIGYNAFYGCSGFTGSLTIPNSVTIISQFAFYGCSGFTGSLTLGNSVATIGKYAFMNCSGFTGSLTLGNSVATIGDFAFLNCSGVTSLTVLAETPPTVTNNYTFYNVPKSIPVYVPCGYVEAYQSAAYWNEFTNIQELCTQFQTIDFSQGWNWVSLSVEAGDPVELLQMLETALVDNAVQIQSFDDNTEFDGEEWFGGLDDTGISNEQMYMIEVVNDCTVELQGTPANPADYEIYIEPGQWNWIGFPCTVELGIAAALADFEPEEGDQIQAGNIMTEFDGEEWFGDFETLVPGQGYMYFSNSSEPKILVFSTTAKGKGVILRKEKN